MYFKAHIHIHLVSAVHAGKLGWLHQAPVLFKSELATFYCLQAINLYQLFRFSTTGTIMI